MANYIKANNTTALNTNGSWTIAGVPTQADTIQWDSMVLGSNTVALGGALNVKGVIIKNPGGAVTIGTTAANFAIDLSGIDMSAATQDLTIASPVVVYLIDGSTQTWNVASGRTLSVSSTLNGSGALIKSNSGTLSLTGGAKPNALSVTLSGGTTTLAGIASGTPNQFGSSASSSVAIATGASLRIQGNTTYTTSSTFTGSGSGTILVRNTSSSGIVFNGTMSGFTGLLAFYVDTSEGLTTAQKITLSAASQFAFSAFYFQNGAGQTSATQTLSYTGNSVLTQTGSIVLAPNSGTFTAIYSNDSSNNSAATVSGTVQLSTATNATLQLAATNGALTFSQVLSETSTGVLSVTKTGNNAATLSSANTFKGAVAVSAGALNANSVTALGAATSTAAISVASGATLSLGAALNYSSPGRTTTINSTGVSNAGALVHAFAGTANVGAINLGNAAYIRGTASGTSTLSSSIATDTGKSLTAGAASGNTLTLTGGISGTGGLVVGNSSSDTGTVALTTANTYQGNTTLSFGTLSLGNATALGSTGTLVFNGGTIDASTAGLTVANAMTASANITFAGTNALTLSGTLALGASRTITTNGSQSLTLSGVVSGVGFKLTKQGDSTLVLTNGSNSYSGGTDLLNGTIEFSSGALGSIGSISIPGATLVWRAGNTQDISSRLTLTNGYTAILDTGANNVTFASSFGGSTSGAIAKYGSGTLSLSASNSYTGGTSIQAGTVSFASGGLGNSGAITFGIGTLRWATGNTQDVSSRIGALGSATFDTNGNNVIFANAIGGGTSGSLTKTGAGILRLAGANAYFGSTIISAGTLQITGTIWSFSDITNNSSLLLDSASAQSLDGIISGTGSIQKSDYGTLAITGQNTYQGNTTLLTGTTQAGNTQAFGLVGSVGLGSNAVLQTLTGTGPSAQKGKLTVASLNNAAGGTIKIGG